MADEELIREIAAKAFAEALQSRSQELAEDVARRMKAALQPESGPLERTKALRDGTMLIAGSRTQTETLEALLAASSALTEGCGLLILRGTQAGGWNCHGLTALDNFKRAVLDCSHGKVAAAIKSCTAVEARASELDPLFVARLRLDSLAKVVLIPVLLKGRIAALLLALAPHGDEATALEVLVQVAQLALDVQAYRKSPPKPAVEAPAQSAAAPEPTQAAEVSQPAAEPVHAAVAPPPAPEPAREEPAALSGPSETESAPAPAEPPVATPAVEVATPEPTPAVVAESAVSAQHSYPAPETIYLPAHREPEQIAAPVAAVPQPEPVSATPEPEPVPTPVASPEVVAEVRAPEPVPVAAFVAAPAFHEIGAVPQSISSPPDASHEKARRFAKLLVEEIKLYNQSKVAEGRARCDLYSRLREDIEKSRAAYHKRYGETVRDVDYFSQELMRILADNNRSVMGAGFPG
jgi:hypothetical protein